jgi:hypothetical protein
MLRQLKPALRASVTNVDKSFSKSENVRSRGCFFVRFEGIAGMDGPASSRGREPRAGEETYRPYRQPRLAQRSGRNAGRHFHGPIGSRRTATGTDGLAQQQPVRLPSPRTTSSYSKGGRLVLPTDPGRLEFGYNYEAVKIFMPANREKPVVVPYIEHVPPDVTACVF